MNAMHTFHIPVMGLAFTMDTPIKVARFGISSVISIMEDNLIEKMRAYYCRKYDITYTPIKKNHAGSRSQRIASYLNLVKQIVALQIEKMKEEDFHPDSDLAKYFELLPSGNHLKSVYEKLKEIKDPGARQSLESYLKQNIVAGSIDVNIMTKPDRDYSQDGQVAINGSDSVTALKGFLESELTDSAVIFSAGFNPRLYNYAASVADQFYKGNHARRIIVKVSDFRSALIQGKYLAKKGLLVDEFRIESGLNCGGHAFATEGCLLGQILEEFRSKKELLAKELFEIYSGTCNNSGIYKSLSISAQGGIGTSHENELLINHYNIQSTGWGTPFLLVPEATTVDEETLDLLCKSDKKDLILSKSSPLGVSFHYLKGTSGEKERLQRIQRNRPGSPCTEKYLATNTEFTEEPICTASSRFQKLKISQINLLYTGERLRVKTEEVLAKECLCVGLSNPAAKSYGFTFSKNTAGSTVCPGPNIVNFSSIYSLKQMVDHIYGREQLSLKPGRSHMFITELHLYIDLLKERLSAESLDSKTLRQYIENLQSGIQYYKDLHRDGFIKGEKFINELTEAEHSIDDLVKI